MKYFSTQTQHALTNFPFPVPHVALKFIYAIAEIKHAAAFANAQAGGLTPHIAEAIQESCCEIVDGKFDDQFVTPTIQGGAGTSINMNVNEVIASRATELLQTQGISLQVHANDHVNLSQSTNDVNPSALRITCLRFMQELQTEVDMLVNAFQQKGETYKNTKKLGRTHLQDAVPITIGQEFAAYADVIYRDLERVMNCSPYLLQLNLGGTAVGDSINASPAYREHVYAQLREITGLPVEAVTNMMSLTSSTADFCAVSAALTILFMDLSKIATDLRILSSGPHGGIGEITLANLQPGSSIMPGKVNPVAAESVNQAFYFIAGKNQSILQASEAASLELAVMFPVVAEGLIASLTLSISVISIFRQKCVDLLTVNVERCSQLLERSSAYATLLTPTLGYDLVSEVVKESVATGVSIHSLVLKKHLLSEKEFEKIIHPQ